MFFLTSLNHVVANTFHILHYVLYYIKWLLDSTQWFLLASCCLAAKSCLTLWDPMDYSPPGSSIHGISQARILEWAAIAFSRESS